MPLLAINGQICAGKHAVADWLIQGHGYKRITFDPNAEHGDLTFNTLDAVLDYTTRNWRQKLVTTDLLTRESHDTLAKRPFFLLITVEAPLLTRYKRYEKKYSPISLYEFAQKSDSMQYDESGVSSGITALKIVNKFDILAALHIHLHELDLTNPDRIRPSWDTYFMRLAQLASLRSNCMKRRVGCVLVRNARVISTGYNGTPRGLVNCNEGGCGRCNSATEGGVGLGTCLCLHAEENALLEAGRERSSESTIYCNTCPCLTCSVKIAQVGIREVVYMMGYSMDERSAEILRNAGVVLRQFSPPYS